MIATIQLPLWTLAAAFCVLCLIPDAIDLARKAWRAVTEGEHGRGGGHPDGNMPGLSVLVAPSVTSPPGKIVVAHPTRVAQADQVAAKEQIESVLLREHVPTTHVYVVDLDKLTALPDDWARDGDWAA